MTEHARDTHGPTSATLEAWYLDELARAPDGVSATALLARASDVHASIDVDERRYVFRRLLAEDKIRLDVVSVVHLVRETPLCVVR